MALDRAICDRQSWKLLAGMPGDGKSLITCDIAACVTRGDVWPDGSGRAPKGAVIILSSEDDTSDTIKPRLAAAGAVMSLCVHLPSMVKIENTNRVFTLLMILASLNGQSRSFARNKRNVRVIIIDPINAYLGGKSKGDAWKTSGDPRDPDTRQAVGRTDKGIGAWHLTFQ